MKNVNTIGSASASGETVWPNKQGSYHTLCEPSVEQELALLKSWCDNTPADSSEYLYNATEFYLFFSSELYATRNAYERNKRQTWDKKSYILYSIGYILASGVSAILTQLILEQISTTPSKAVIGIAGCILVVGAIMVSIYGWRSKRAYDETWARHSARYHRLRLILSQFLLSQKTAKEFNLLVQKTFAILERNLDQFELNISSKGLVEAKVTDMEGL